MSKQERIAFLIERIKGMIPSIKQGEPKNNSESNGEGESKGESENKDETKSEPKEIKEETELREFKSGGPNEEYIAENKSEPKEESKEESKDEIKESNGSFEDQFIKSVPSSDPLITFENIVVDIQEAPKLYGGNIIVSLKSIKEYINKTVNNITPK